MINDHPETDSNTRPKPTKVNKERQFKGLSLTERKHARREKLIEAGIETYGTQGFFRSPSKTSVMKPS